VLVLGVVALVPAVSPVVVVVVSLRLQPPSTAARTAAVNTIFVALMVFIVNSSLSRCAY
jgi:hypothetical protein